MEVIDIEARALVGKVQGELDELEMDYWGPDRHNGKRSQIIENSNMAKTLQTALRHYLDAERAQTCIGIKALGEHKKDHSKEVEEEVEVRVAKINRQGVSWQAWAALAGQVVMILILIFKG